jgi:hypothetical protein
MAEVVAGQPLDFGLHGHIDHITHSFAMAGEGGGRELGINPA